MTNAKPRARGLSGSAVHSHSPIYLQLAETLRQQIDGGRFQAGDALPSERDLCAIMQASRVTVRKAIEVLIADGLLARRQGSGTYVTPRIQAPGSYLTSFSEDAAARGGVADTIWMEKAVGPATDDEARLLSLAPDTPVARLSRVRMADGEPLAIENAVVPAALLPDLAELGASLYAALAAGNHRPISGRQIVRAALAGPTEARLLGIAEGSEILRIERLTRRADGTPVEYTRSTYRGERYEFVSELRGPFVSL